MKRPLIALTIAGFDPSSGAGITSDIKVFRSLGLYGLSVASALTAQNSKGVKDVLPVEARFLQKQLLCLSEDIKIDCIKLGMLYSESAIKVVSRFLSKEKIKIVVLDPVIRSSSGRSLIEGKALQSLQRRLLPLTTVVTPNIGEAEMLSGMKIRSLDDIKYAAKRILRKGPSSVVITGGHFSEFSGCEKTLDIVFDGRDFIEIQGSKFKYSYHGTGCAYSSALTAYLAKGMNIFNATKGANQFVRKAIQKSLALGSGMRLLCF